MIVSDTMLEIDFSDEANSKIGKCDSCKRTNITVIASWTYNAFMCRECSGEWCRDDYIGE